MSSISRTARILRWVFDDEVYMSLIQMYASLYRDNGDKDFAIMACELINNFEPGEGD